MPNAVDLTTVADFKTYLGITSATDDALIQRLVTSASKYIQSWLNRNFAIQSYVQQHDGNGSALQAFSTYPVQSVSEVLINGLAIPLSADQKQRGYFFSDKFLYLANAIFTKGLFNVKITYTAGYATVPEEIAQACIELCALRYKERNRVGEVTKNIAGETISFSQKDFPAGVKTILNNYKKVIPF